MAFAGPNLEEEFKTAKKQQIDSELGIDDKKLAVLSQGIRRLDIIHIYRMYACRYWLMIAIKYTIFRLNSL